MENKLQMLRVEVGVLQIGQDVRVLPNPAKKKHEICLLPIGHRTVAK